MPKLGGMGLLEVLQSDPRTREVPVVFLSGQIPLERLGSIRLQMAHLKDSKQAVAGEVLTADLAVVWSAMMRAVIQPIVNVAMDPISTYHCQLTVVPSLIHNMISDPPRMPENADFCPTVVNVPPT